MFKTAVLYLKWRFITRTHLIDTKLEIGQWHDSDSKMLHGMFELLVDFVEVECANMYVMCFNDDCEDAGRKYLLATDEYTTYEHIEKNKKVLRLYDWWKTQRPARAPLDFSDAMSWWDIEQERYEEDTKMLIELAKIRQYLWS